MLESFRLSTFLPYRLAVLAERVSRHLHASYQESHGLSVAEWRVLVHLHQDGEVSIRDIHARVNLEKSRVSRAVSRLEEARLVKKRAGQGDARLVSISLTARGLTVLGQIVPVVTRMEARLLEDLTARELDIFSKVIDKIHRKLDEGPAAEPAQSAGRAMSHTDL